jgi:hypothetical protein
MAYDESLAERIRTMLPDQPVVEKKMFGGLAFLIAGNLSVAASGQGGLLVRVDPEQTGALLDEPGAELMEMGGRSMNGWLRVQPDVLDDRTLRTWVDRGVGYACTLPAK